jgi:hypothetical protein
MITNPLLPNFQAQPARGNEDGIASCGGEGVVPMAQHFLRVGMIAFANWLMTAFRVVRAITTDACEDFMIGSLLEQALQHRRVTGGVVRDFACPDFQRRIDAKVDLAPVMMEVEAVFLCRPLAFAEHLDAGAVYQGVRLPMATRRRPRNLLLGLPRTAVRCYLL